ncbi:BQ5605_C013g07190 [Microbotryum silenes-dioicae]|uniref:BQ5605_C013g07190 protein n=1 Tax=Microbotryum silenes-dioicae TaxID=796604 RepID=A0A2X0LUJ1_9BASI|nr:BQ5605_C013g07190 [Microbotryum silenes-dioicae]
MLHAQEGRRADFSAMGLPTSLASFLGSYPQPTCAFPATPLYDALITRQILGSIAERQYGAVQSPMSNQASPNAGATAGANDSASTSAGASSSTNLPTEPAAHANQASSQDVASDPSGFSSSLSVPSRPATPSNHAGATASDRVLASAFRGSNRVLNHGHSGGYAGSTTSSATSASRTASRYLEGGKQLAHDPSRTAEGAVAAMHEQHERQVAQDEAAVRAGGVPQRRTIPSTFVEEPSFAASDQWAAKCNAQTTRDRADEGKGLGLGELLTPEWSNTRWTEMMATQASQTSNKDEDTLNLLSILGRQDLQGLLALLVEVLSFSHASTSSSTDHTITISPRFPPHSIHHRSRRTRSKMQFDTRPKLSPPSSREDGISPLLSSLPGRKGSITSITSSSGGGNIYTLGSTASGSSTHDDGEPILHIVANYVPEHDVIVFTTLTSNIFRSAPESTPGSFFSSATPVAPAAETTSPPPPDAPKHPSRPPLLSRDTTVSFLSTISSTTTARPGQGLSNVTPSSAFPTPSALEDTTPDCVSPIIASPLPSDRLPEPPLDDHSASKSSLYNDASGQELLDPRVQNINAHMFVSETRLKRKRTSTVKRSSRDIGLSTDAVGPVHEESQSSGVSRAQTNSDSEHQSIAHPHYEPDGPLLMHDEDESDRDLDRLRDRTRTGSVNDDNGDEGEPEEEPEDQALEFDFRTPRIEVGGLRKSPLSQSAGLATFISVISQTPCGRLIAAYSWEKTTIGALGSWSQELRTLVMLTLSSPFRAALWWGEDSVLIYNDEYARLLGSRHPRLLGLSGAEGWSEIWDTLGPLAAKVMQGETVAYYDHHLPMLRNGTLEETYHCWSFLPIRDVSGSVVGYENTSFETTARVIAERRLATLRDLTQVTQLARATEEFCAKTLQVLALNEYDLPFALMYTVDQVNPTHGQRLAGSSTDGAQSSRGSRSKSNGTGISSSRQQIIHLKLTLQGTIGVPDGHKSAPPEVNLQIDPTQASTRTESESEETTSTASQSSINNTESNSIESGTDVWPFLDACQRRKPVFINDLGGRATGFAQRGWPTPLKHAVVIPIVTQSGNDTSSAPRAVLVLGINPRRPWNEVFATFLSLLARHLSNGLLAVSMAENDAQRNEELVQLDRAKTTFFSSVSHELRTPLTLILGPLEDVLSNKSGLSPEDREQLQTVQRHSNRLLNMVNSLLDFSRLEGGRMEVSFRPMNLAAVTADLASLFRSAIERGGVQLIVNCPADPFKEASPVYLSGELYEKVIFNLLGNAFKYTLSGSIETRVSFTAQSAKVEIIDTGCGIADTELDRIFERFHRVEGTSRSREGTGIGLALTLELVKALGGNLSVASKFGEGSTFTVVFPRGSAHLPSSQILESGETLTLPPRAHASLAIIEEAASWKVDSSIPDKDFAPKPSSTSSTHSSDGDLFNAVPIDVLNLKDSTVLLCDDNQDLRRYIASLLSKSFNVVQVADGQEALEYAIKKPPSLIVTDVMMPRLDGNELLKALRNNPTTALIPVIFLSAQAGSEARVQALLSGADDYLSKPFQGRELLARCNVHLQIGKMRNELERRVEERTRALVESEMRYRGLADRYSTLSLLSPVGIYLVNAEGTLNYANPRWYEISGFPQDKPLAQWRDCVHPDDLPALEKIWDETIVLKPKHMTKRELVSHEFRFKDRENWVLWEMRSFSESGLRRGFVGSITDITASKRLEKLHLRAVEQRAADAEENRRNTELFLDLSSHELRNPLSAVWQNAEVVSSSLEKFIELIDELKEGEVPEQDVLEQLHDEMLENVEAVESIILCANHQQRIANDILNVSKLNMGLLTINLAPFDVTAKMHEVLKMFEVECAQKQIKLRVEKGRSLTDLGAEWLIADSGRISQILINFLSNSVKFTTENRTRVITIHTEAYSTPPPCPPNALRVDTAQAQSTPNNHVWLVVGVRDSGKGLGPEDMKKLFARFAQANPKSGKSRFLPGLSWCFWVCLRMLHLIPTTDQYGGSGLGLYVSRKLVELHQGYIEVESAVGQGAVFRFAIPAERSGPPGFATTSPATSRISGASPPLSTIAEIELRSSVNTKKLEQQQLLRKQQPPHVLVVESRYCARLVQDNVINSRVLTRQLKLNNFLVTPAFNGQEALDAIEKDGDFSVILMDIEMPVMDGLTTIREIRRREAAGQTKKRYPVIAVTGNARSEQVKVIRESGFDDVALKPYKMASVLAQIQVLTQKE